MFIGRERELASLKEFYDKDGIGMTVIYGRRRIGKSTLIAEFVKDKKTIFYFRFELRKEAFADDRRTVAAHGGQGGHLYPDPGQWQYESQSH